MSKFRRNGDQKQLLLLMKVQISNLLSFILPVMVIQLLLIHFPPDLSIIYHVIILIGAFLEIRRRTAEEWDEQDKKISLRGPLLFTAVIGFIMITYFLKVDDHIVDSIIASLRWILLIVSVCWFPYYLWEYWFKRKDPSC